MEKSWKTQSVPPFEYQPKAPGPKTKKPACFTEPAKRDDAEKKNMEENSQPTENITEQEAAVTLDTQENT